MDLGIKGRVALVTGGDSGIGMETARQLLGEGAWVALSDKEPETLERAAKALAGLGEIVPIVADVTRPDDVERLIREAGAKFGPPQILVHAAGITGPTGDFLTLTDDDWRLAIEVDLLAATRVVRATLPGMKAAGWGRIVLIGSEDAEQPYPDELPYCACKAAILNLSKGLSKAYAKDGILVNAVSPAFIETPMTDAMMEKRSQEKGTSFDKAVQTFLKEERPSLVLGRRGQTHEVASAIVYLCSERSSFITGANVRVDGGSVATV